MGVKVFEELVLPEGQLTLFLTQCEELFFPEEAVSTHLDGAVRQGCRGCEVFAPERIVYTDDHFFHAERLPDIIVAAQGKTFYDVFRPAFCRDKKDGDIPIQATDLLGDLEPVLIGK